MPKRRLSSVLAIVAFVLLLVVGLLVRLWLVQFKGGEDMDSYVLWGKQTAVLGLGRGYTGIYFPIQYQLFGLAYQMAIATGQSTYASIKEFNLVADVGSLLLILRQLTLWKLSRGWALAYWLNPFLLVAFAQGYVDFQWAFLLLAAIWITSEFHSMPASYVASGVLIGATTVMKPQAVAIPVIVGIYIALRLVFAGPLSRVTHLPPFPIEERIRRSWRLAWYLISPGVFFIAYSIYFRASGRSLLSLAHAYLQEGQISPALTAHMLNVWYPVAYALRADDQQIWMVIGPGVLHGIAAVLTAAALVIGTIFVARLDSGSRSFPTLLALATLASLTIPMLFTGAHDNHLFMGCVLSVLVMAAIPSTVARVGLSAVTLLQAFNTFAIYGLGENSLSQAAIVTRVVDWYQYPIRDAAAILDVAVFAFAIWGLSQYAHALSKTDEQRAYAHLTAESGRATP